MKAIGAQVGKTPPLSQWLREQKLQDYLVGSFQRIGASPIRDASVGPIEFDVVVPRKGLPPLAIEFKHWEPVDTVASSTGLAKEMSVASGADVALLLPSLRKGNPQRGVYGAADLDPLLEAWSGYKPHTRKAQAAPPAVETNRPSIFPAMPFDTKFNDVFVRAIVPAADAVGATVKRVDEPDIFFNQAVIDEIKQRIGAAKLVICDLSGKNPNVMWECGYAHALEKFVIHITSDRHKALPFDTQDWPTHRYVRGGVEDTLVKALEQKVRAAFRAINEQKRS